MGALGAPEGGNRSWRFKQVHSWPADNLLGPNLGVFGAKRKSLPICAAAAALIHKRRFGTSNLCTILRKDNFLFDLIVTSVATVHLWKANFVGNWAICTAQFSTVEVAHRPPRWPLALELVRVPWWEYPPAHFFRFLFNPIYSRLITTARFHFFGQIHRTQWWLRNLC